MYDRRTGESPGRHARMGILLNVAAPDHLAARGVQAKQITPPAECENPAPVNGRRACRPAIKVFVAQIREVTVPPDFLARRRIETENCILIFQMAHRVNSPAGRGERRESGAHFGLPKNRWTIRVPTITPPCFGGDAVVVRPAPLGPVIGRCGGVKNRHPSQNDCAWSPERRKTRQFLAHH